MNERFRRVCAGALRSGALLLCLACRREPPPAPGIALPTDPSARAPGWPLAFVPEPPPAASSAASLPASVPPTPPPSAEPAGPRRLAVHALAGPYATVDDSCKAMRQRWDRCALVAPVRGRGTVLELGIVVLDSEVRAFYPALRGAAGWYIDEGTIASTLRGGNLLMEESAALPLSSLVSEGPHGDVATFTFRITVRTATRTDAGNFGPLALTSEALARIFCSLRAPASCTAALAQSLGAAPFAREGDALFAVDAEGERFAIVLP